MALDYAPLGIRVNAICPAAVWSPLLREWASHQHDPVETADRLQSLAVLGYCPEGDVIADAATFLISEKARFITGTVLPVAEEPNLATGAESRASSWPETHGLIIIDRFSTHDVRFPLNPGEGSDAVHSNPQYHWRSPACTARGDWQPPE